MWTIPISEAKARMVLQLDGVPFKGVVDTGADVTIIRMEEAEKMKWKTKTGPNIQGVEDYNLPEK